MLADELHVTPGVLEAAVTATRLPKLLVNVYRRARLVAVVQNTGVSSALIATVAAGVTVTVVPELVLVVAHSGAPAVAASLTMKLPLVGQVVLGLQVTATVLAPLGAADRQHTCTTCQ